VPAVKRGNDAKRRLAFKLASLLARREALLLAGLFAALAAKAHHFHVLGDPVAKKVRDAI
jgi:hypothetical protein